MSDLVTIDAAKSILQVDDITRDSDIAQYVSAASFIIEDIVGPVIARTVTQTFDGGSDSVILSDTATAITSITENGVMITDYTPNLTAGVVYAGLSPFVRYFYPGRQNIVVTYTVGAAADMDSVPANIVLAACELVRIWWQNGQNANFPALANANYDATEYSPSGFAVPREIYALCKPQLRAPSV